MAHRILDSIRRTCAAAALLLAATATGANAEEIDFAWPENPFALTLSDQLFVDTGEARFEKAGRVFGDAMSGSAPSLATSPASRSATRAPSASSPSGSARW
ncbi:MAG: hypothetical protein R3D59_14695 [Paracoccaceae bacterium]